MKKITEPKLLFAQDLPVNEDDDHRMSSVKLENQCHPKAGLTVSAFAQLNMVEISCEKCGQTIVAFAIADKPKERKS